MTNQVRKRDADKVPPEGEGAREREIVRAFVLKLVGDPSLADDLAQETLLRAHKSQAEFKGDASRQTWLHVIALNVVRDHFRAASRRPRLVTDPEALLALEADSALDDELLQSEMAYCIRQYVLRLPERQRDVVALHDIAGLTHREVAAALDISQSNSRILLHRGRAALRHLLEENCLLCFDDPVPCQPKQERGGSRRRG